jgi:tetratricopeptide (TPR) repeat protein
MLRFIARELKETPILILGTFREAEVRASPALSRLIGEIAREGHQIVLRGLSQTEVAQFVRERIGASPDPALLDALMQATAGNPLFVDAILRMLTAERKELNGGVLSTRDFKVPDAVAETIRRRLSFLSESANALLSIGAVIGQEFEFECLRKTSGRPVDALVEAVDEARRDGVVYSVLAGNLRYRFAHDLIRETIYEDIPAPKRIELHWRIAKTLEQIHEAELTTHSAEIAHHHRESVTFGDPAKAIVYSIRAGDAALSVSAYEETRSHWQAALALMERYEPGSPHRAGLLRRLGALTCEAIDFPEGTAYLEAALKHCRENGDDRELGLVHLEFALVKAAYHGPRRDIWEALAHYQAAEPLLDPKDLRSRARLYLGLTLINSEAFLINEGLDVSERAMKMHRELGDDFSWCITAAHRNHYLRVRGRLAEATSLLNRVHQVAMTIVDRQTSRLAVWIYYTYIAQYHLYMRAPLEAKRLYTLAVETPGLSKLQRQRNFDPLALVDYLRGDLNSAREMNSPTLSFQARIALREGDWDGAQALMQQFLDWTRAAGDKYASFDTLNHIVEICYLTGDYDGALAALPEVLGTYQSADQFCEMRTRPTATLLALEFGKTDEAVEHLEICRRIAHQGEDWLGWMGSVTRAEAALAAAECRIEDAANSFEDSIRIFKKFGLIWDAADTLHLWGRVFLRTAKHASALEKLDGAIDLYRRYGAGQRWIERVEADRRRAVDTAARAKESQAQACTTSQPSCSWYCPSNNLTMPNGINCLYCCQLAIVILVPIGGGGPWLAVSFRNWVSSLRSVDCAQLAAERTNSASRAAMQDAIRVTLFILSLRSIIE